MTIPPSVEAVTKSATRISPGAACGAGFADHHDHTVTADHFALIADRLNARLDLHRIPFDCNLITGEIRGSSLTLGNCVIL